MKRSPTLVAFSAIVLLLATSLVVLTAIAWSSGALADYEGVVGLICSVLLVGGAAERVHRSWTTKYPAY